MPRKLLEGIHLRRKDREIKEVIDFKDIEGKYGESVSWERLAK
jgi:hypothetical protein